MVGEVVLGSAIRQNLNAVSRAQNVVDETSTRISTGRRVNSPLDQPQNFFAASSLSNRANDYSRLIDNINLSVRTIEETLQGVQALSRLLNQADAIATESQRLLEQGITDPAIEQQIIDLTPVPLSQQILAANPVAYYRLDDSGGGIADNLGTGGATLDGTYDPGVANGADLYSNDALNSSDFDGANGRIRIGNDPLINAAAHPERTIELVFNADNTNGRQILWEEGGNFNAVNIYIESGRLHYNATEVNEYGPFNLSVPIDAGETYHVALVFDGPDNELRAYLDGQEVGTRAVNNELAIHTGGIGIGALNGFSIMHDGQSPVANTHFFNGRISDVAIYNDALSDFEIFSHAESLDSTFITNFIHSDFEKVLAEIDNLTEDASFRGLNLLAGDNLITEFNDDRTNTLTTRGVDFTFEGLDILNINFNDDDQLQDIIDSVQDAIKRVRDYGNTLTNDIGIMNTRLDFTRGIINNHLAGVDDLTAADVTEEGTKQLAASTRLQISQSALASLSQSQTSVLQLFAGSLFG